MNLIFDFDGTICDSLDALLGVINPVLKKLRKGILTKEEIREKGAARLLKEKGIPKFLLPIIVVYARHRLTQIIPNQKPFKDIKKVIQSLSTNNTLGIVTSNSTKNVNEFLQNNDMNEFFTFIYQSVNYLDKSTRISNALVNHNLKSKETYFIGDETRDINAAKLAGVKAIAVTWGVEGENLLKRSKPDKIVHKPKDLLVYFTL